jgi:hypothetical protein
MGRARFAPVVLLVSSGAANARGDFFRRPPVELDLVELDPPARTALEARCTNPFICTRAVQVRAQAFRPWLAAASVAVDPQSGEV